MKNSLRKNSLFRRVYGSGRYYANRLLTVHILENDLDHNRLGISVSKKVGNSVVRHRLTRLVRESYRLNENRFNSGLDMVVVIRANAAQVKKCREIESALLHACSHLKIVKPEMS